MEELKEILIDFRNSVKQRESEELPESEWDKLIILLYILFGLQSEKWFEEFTNLLKKRAGENRRLLCHFTDIPPKPHRAIKAFTACNSATVLLISGLITDENINSFVWKLLKKVAPGEEQSCRGYYSRYFESEYMLNNFLNDVTKDVVIKAMRPIVEKDEQIISKVQEFQAHLLCTSAYALGVEDDLIETINKSN